MIRPRRMTPSLPGGSATAGDAVADVAMRLAAAGIDEARREARLLVALALGVEPAVVLGFPERPIDAAAQERLNALTARRAAREPYARLAGRRQFWSLDLEISPDTLDPRPDSETLVEAALALLPDRAAPLRILDFGTGSGCLLLALLSELPNAVGIGIDILPGAVATARRNATALGLAERAFFAAGSWGETISCRVDVIIANPPYIPSTDMKVQDETRARMSLVSDPYLRERLADLEDLGNRLQQHLTGHHVAAAVELPAEFILVARSMGPAELLDYDRRRLKALVLEEGSPTAHVAVVARALDIPVVGRVKDVLAKVEAGDLVVVEGDEGVVLLRPGEDIQQAVNARIDVRLGQRLSYAALRDLPAETRGGERVSLQLNAGLLLDLPYLDETGAEGVGLFRTELLFMLREDFPTVGQQASVYRRVLEHAGDRPVTFRTLDIGGDKLLPYMSEIEDENPAMGWRAIRISLDRPALLRQQLRALIRAARDRRLRVMFPMIADIAEFEAARAVLDLEIERSLARGHKMPAKIEVGVMFEVPALLWELPQLLPKIDFLSVGTNDLVQFLFAADRGNPKLAERYDTLSLPVMQLLGDVARTCAEHNVPLTLCGEMAGHPLDAMALVGIGFRVLSMAPGSIGPVKAMIRSLDLAPLAGLLAGLPALPPRSLRSRLRDFARDHGVVV